MAHGNAPVNSTPRSAAPPTTIRNLAEAEPRQQQAATLTLEEVAALARVSQGVIRRAVEAGTFPRPVRVGRLMRWPRAVVYAALGLS